MRCMCLPNFPDKGPMTDINHTSNGLGNPLLEPFETPFGAPPFDRIRSRQFPEAFKAAFAEERAEIRKIVECSEAPSFANTIEALGYSGALLRRVKNLFSNLRSAEIDDELQAIAREVLPQISRHNDDILMDETLFERVRTVWESRDSLDLPRDAQMLLETTWKDFVRGGAALESGQKETLRRINEELTELSVRYSENVLAETNSFELVLHREEDLEGLPSGLVEAARLDAESRGYEGKWVFHLQKPSWIPFLRYSPRRDLRERLYRGYFERCDRDNEHDNKEIAVRKAVLRARRARLLGYSTHAHYVLDRNMAQTPEAVRTFLEELWEPARRRALTEAQDMQALINREGGGFELAPWDWWYYAEKVRKERYDLDEEALRPYFELDAVRRGAFDVASRLFGITFESVEVPTYHPEVEAFEVRDADGSHLGLFYTDYFPRPGKRVGAWMNNYQDQWMEGERDVRPHVVNVANFPRPAGDDPALLSWEEVLTLFHELGHALHGLLSRGRYPSLTGTDVPRDFVEFPSQVLENWAAEPEVLRGYARHWRSGESIPEELVSRLAAASRFNQGFVTTEYLAASFLDLAWHTLDGEAEPDCHQLEEEAMAAIDLPAEILPRYRSTYFSHVFGGGYSAGYYSYIWAEVLDADAFDAFRRRDLFDPELAKALRTQVLERGHGDEPMTLYRKFRGADPVIEPLLERRGLTTAA